MTSAKTKSAPAKTEADPEVRQAVLKEIASRWNKFSEQDLADFKNKDDVVVQVVAKYGLNKVLAQRDVDALLKGRSL